MLLNPITIHPSIHPADQATEVTANKDTSHRLLEAQPECWSYQALPLNCRAPQCIPRTVAGDGQGSKSELCSYSNQESKKTKTHFQQWLASYKDGSTLSFAEKRELISISRKNSSKEIASDIMKAHEIDKKCYTTHNGERLETDPPAKKFHD